MQHRILEINGTEYMAVFNTAVLTRCEELGIDYRTMDTNPKPMTAVSRMMCLMIESGSLYAKASKLGDYPTMTFDDFAMFTDMNDLERFKNTIAELILGDRKVDAVPPKKQEGDAEAAQTN